MNSGNPHFHSGQPGGESSVQLYRVDEACPSGTNQRDIWVDIAAAFERKMAAIERHAS